MLDQDGNQKVRVRKGKGKEYLWEKINVPANYWNDRSNAERWRASWSEHCNRYLEQEQQIDHRSYERQGLDIEPTVHEGVVARKMEQDGQISDRCEMNREIRERNTLRQQLSQLWQDMKELMLKKARETIERIKSGRKMDGDTGGSEQRVGGNLHGKGSDDTIAFLSELSAEERASEEKRDNSFAERADRDAERKRQDAYRSQADDERRREAAERERRNPGRSR